MTEKDKMLEAYEDEHDCTCGEEGCDCGEESNIISLELEDGSTKDFLVLDVIDLETGTYMALAEVGSNEYDILRVEGEEAEDNLELVVIEDDEEFNKIAKLFQERFEAFDELEDM